MASSFPQYQITATSELADDHFVLTQVTVKESPVLPVVAPIARRDNGLNGRLDALVVTVDGKLAYVYQDKTVSGGWQVSYPVATTAALEVVAGWQLDGAYYAFYEDGTSLYRLKGVPAAGPIAWSLDATLPLASYLGVAYDPANALSVYGLTGTGGGGASLQLYYWGEGNVWTGQTTTLPGFYGARSAPRLGYFTGSAWNLAVVTTTTSGGSALVGYTYSGNNGSATAGAPATVQLDTSQNAPVQILAPFLLAAEVGFFFGDQQGNLYCSVTNGNTAKQILSHAATFTGGCGFTDANQRFNLMVVDSRSNLWLLQQTGVQQQLPTFTPLIPLDGGSLGCFFDPATPRFTELLGIDASLQVKHILQDPVYGKNGGLWRAYTVPMPSPEILSLTTYRSRVQVTDNYGTPAANKTVAVAVDRSVPLWWNGQCHLATAGGAPVTLQTDGAGCVTVAIPATDLLTATLSFTCENQALAAVEPHAPLHAFLSGSGALPYAAGARPSAPLSFTSTTLASAQTYQSNGAATGTAVAGGLGGNGGSNLATAATQAIQAGSGFAVQAAQARRAGHPAPLQAVRAAGGTGLTLDLSTTGSETFAAQPVYTVFSSGTTTLQQVVDTLADDALNELDSLWNGIKNGVAAITKVVIDLEEEVVVFEATIAGALKTFFLDLAEGVESLISAVQAIFAAIGADLEKLLNWLRALFDWQNYVNTKNQIVGILDKLGSEAAAELSALQTRFDTLMATAEQDVQTLFQTLENKLGSQSMAQLLGGSSQAAPTGGAPTTGAGAGGTGQPDVHGSWLLDKVQTILFGSSDWSPGRSGPDQALITQLETQLGNLGSDILTALEDVLSVVETLFGGDYGAVTISQILAEIEGALVALLKGAQALIDALFDVAIWGVQQIGSSTGGGVLGQQFNLLGIGTLLDFVLKLAGESPPSANWPQISDVAAWIFAIPLTVGYEIITGSPPFPSASATPQAGPTSFVMEAVALPAGAMPAAAPAAPAPAPSSTADTWQVLLGLAGYVAVLLDTWMDVLPTDQTVPTSLAFVGGVTRMVPKGIVKEAYTLNDNESAALTFDTLLGGFNVFAAFTAWVGSSRTGRSMRFLSPPGGPAAVSLLGLCQLAELLLSPDPRDQSVAVLLLPFYNVLELVHIGKAEQVLLAKGVFNFAVGIDILINGNS